jgi:hypothetical protein
MSVDDVLGRLLAMHKEAVMCEEGGVEWVRIVDMMARMLDAVAAEWGRACLLELMCMFSERTGDGIHIDAARLQWLIETGAVRG